MLCVVMFWELGCACSCVRMHAVHCKFYHLDAVSTMPAVQWFLRSTCIVRLKAQAHCHIVRHRNPNAYCSSDSSYMIHEHGAQITAAWSTSNRILSRLLFFGAAWSSREAQITAARRGFQKRCKHTASKQCISSFVVPRPSRFPSIRQ